MSRLAPSIAILIVASTGLPALAADYGEDWSAEMDFRSSYQSYEPKDWNDLGEEGDGIHIETGLRYWYSMGTESFAINSGLTGDPGQVDVNDQSHSVEGYFRIDDDATSVYLKGVAGVGFSMTGEATDSFGDIDVKDGKLGYAGADFGYSLLPGEDFKLGGFAGYMYWNNSPNTHSDNFTTAQSADDIVFDPVDGQTTLPMNSITNNIDIHMLRLGVSGKAEAGMFDFTAELAAVPYASINGTLGANAGFASGGPVSYDNPSDPSYGPTGLTGAFNIHNIQSSPTTINGWGYGGMAELMAGFHPTENLTFRLGGRAWYVQGTADTRYSRANIGDPTDANPPNAGDPLADPPVPPQLNAPNFDTPPTFGNTNYVVRSNPWSAFRYGLLAEITYSF